jgi:hypothetical protein
MGIKELIYDQRMLYILRVKNEREVTRQSFTILLYLVVQQAV